MEFKQWHSLAASLASCFSQCVCKPLKLLKSLSASSCSTMSFVFNFYQYGDAATTPPRPRPKTAARPLPALLPPGDWSEPTRRRSGLWCLRWFWRRRSLRNLLRPRTKLLPRWARPWMSSRHRGSRWLVHLWRHKRLRPLEKRRSRCRKMPRRRKISWRHTWRR